MTKMVSFETSILLYAGKVMGMCLFSMNSALGFYKAKSVQNDFTTFVDSLKNTSTFFRIVSFAGKTRDYKYS